jgi:5'-nucleotidase
MRFRNAFFSVVLAAFGVLQAENGFTLNILHLNDTHSNLLPVSLPVYLDSMDSTVRIPAGGVARIASEVRRAKREDENVLFLHAGDLVQGTLFYTVYGGRADAAVYNAMAPDVMALGNHEFDRGSEGLAFLLDEILFPVVCANIDVEADSLLRGRIAPYIVLETGGERIGVIGLITVELADVSSPSEQTIVLPILETAQRAVAELEEQGVNKIIILSHIGYANDIQLATSLRGVDVIVGGHSHTLLGDFSHLGLSPEGEYPEVVTGPDGNPVLVVTAWFHGQVLGRLRVHFDGEGRVSGWLGSPVIITGAGTGDPPGVLNMNEDLLVADIVHSYTVALEDFQNEYVATAETDLPNIRVPGGQWPQGSAIAPIVCDAMLWKANRLGIGADIALQNAGGVRISVQEGDISIGTVYSLLPFGNTLVVMEATGGQIRTVIEEALSGIFDSGRSDGSFPYVAGLRYVAARNAPAGERVLTLEARTPDGYIPVDSAAVYRVVTNTFVAGGGDGYESLAGIPSTDTGFIDAEVLTEYLRMMGTVKPVEQRVFITGE